MSDGPSDTVRDGPVDHRRHDRGSEMTPQELSDRVEIAELLSTYASALSHGDWDGFRGSFTADAAVDYSSAGGPAGTVSDAVAWLQPTMGIFDLALFQVSNIIVTVTGSDTASVESMFRSVMRIPAGDGGSPTVMQAIGYYHDEVTRTAAGWRLSSRTESLGGVH
jgi:hypothetical protein